MNIAIDVSTTAGFRTGTEEYIEGLVFGLHRAGVGVVGVGRETQALVPDKPRLGLPVRPSPSVWRKWWWEYVAIRRVPRDVDVLHIPFLAHPQARLAIPTVVTVHDLIPFRLASYRKNLKERQYFSHIERALPFADRLVAISEATRQDALELFPALAGKLSVIPNGVHPDFFADVDGERISQVLRRYGLRQRPRLLYVGGYDERKNVPLLLRAIADVFRRRRDGELVLVGAQDNLVIRRLVAELGLDARVAVTPFISRAELVALYNSADLFVYPSRYEGFGMPPAQALVAGVPVIASDIPALREVVGDYGVLVAPEAQDAWTEAIQRSMDTPATLHKMVVEGQLYAERFSWERVATAYVGVYRLAIEGRQ
ncbi:MAG: glycosyltransferase family 1 protein [Firmicutes bacterium]|nr:glycosyltransferase family 1 protein [Bacillota bacterium]